MLCRYGRLSIRGSPRGGRAIVGLVGTLVLSAHHSTVYCVYTCVDLDEALVHGGSPLY